MEAKQHPPLQRCLFLERSCYGRTECNRSRLRTVRRCRRGIAYLTFIPAIIFLIVAPYNKNSYVRFHSWQSIFLGVAAIVIEIARHCLDYPRDRFGCIHPVPVA